MKSIASIRWGSCVVLTACLVSILLSPAFASTPATAAGSSPSPSAASQVLQVAAGSAHTCAVMADHRVRCWGRNHAGQLGDGTTTDRRHPVEVAGLPAGVAAVAVGGATYSGGHTCALTVQGGVKCWGWNGYGQLGDGTTTDRSTPVDVVGLDGGVLALAAGRIHTCALTDAAHGSRVKCWGGNVSGQLGDGAGADRPVPADVPGLGAVPVALATSSPDASTACAIIADTTGLGNGGVKCWGMAYVGNGSAMDSTTPVPVVGAEANIKAVAVGTWGSCLLTSEGGVRCWGPNQSGQAGDGTTQRRYTPVPVAGLNGGVVALSAGAAHACALTAAGGLKCWGESEFGQLGNGSRDDRYFPVDVTGLQSGVASVSAGESGTCAVMSSGGLKCWGSGLNSASPADVQMLRLPAYLPDLRKPYPVIDPDPQILEASAAPETRLTVAVLVASHDVARVEARVEDRTVNLAFGVWWFKMYSTPAWLGSIPLMGLARGEHELVVTAWDGSGEARQATRRFVYDRRPVLTVEEPFNGSLARPTALLSARCTDDDPGGCVKIVALVDSQVLAEGVSEIHQEVSLEAYRGRQVWIDYAAVDSAGQTTRSPLGPVVYVEDTLRLLERARSGGRIVDATVEKILYEDNSDGVIYAIQDRATGQTEVIQGLPSGESCSFITPKGAMCTQHEWRDGQPVPAPGFSGYLGFPWGYPAMLVRGPYAVLRTGPVLYLRDLIAGSDTVVATNAMQFDLAADGTVVWESVAHELFRYRSGTVEWLAADGRLPFTDGINVAYLKQLGCCGEETTWVAAYAGGAEVLLAKYEVETGVVVGADYAVSGGWIAFTRGPEGQRQVWLRSPDGQERQATSFAGDTTIQVLAPSGEVVVSSGLHYYLVSPSSGPLLLQGLPAHSLRWNDRGWELALGNVLYGLSRQTAFLPMLTH